METGTGVTTHLQARPRQDCRQTAEAGRDLGVLAPRTVNEFLLFKPPGSGHFVTVALGHDYTKIGVAKGGVQRWLPGRPRSPPRVPSPQ